MQKPIILIGFMGCGKTTIGSRLSQELERPFIDLDQKIVEQEKRSIHSIFQTEGEAYFRQIESEVLAQVLNTNAVISTGGGVVKHSENCMRLKDQKHVFYLKTAISVLYERVNRNNGPVRPLGNHQTLEQFEQLFLTRKSAYEQCASYIVPTDDLSLQQIVKTILLHV